MYKKYGLGTKKGPPYPPSGARCAAVVGLPPVSIRALGFDRSHARVSAGPSKTGATAASRRQPWRVPHVSVPGGPAVGCAVRRITLADDDIDKSSRPTGVRYRTNVSVYRLARPPLRLTARRENTPAGEPLPVTGH